MCKRIIYSVVGIVLIFTLVFSSTVAFASEARTTNEADLSKTVEIESEFAGVIENLKEGPTKGNMTVTVKMPFSEIKKNVVGAVTFTSIVNAVYKLLSKTGLELVTTKAQLAAMLKQVCDAAKLIALVKAGSNAHGLKITLRGATYHILENGINVQKIKWVVKSITKY